MTVCSHRPVRSERSCRACIQAQIEHHMPSLLDTGERRHVDAEGAVVARFPRFRFGSRLRRRRVRRAA